MVSEPSEPRTESHGEPGVESPCHKTEPGKTQSGKTQSAKTQSAKTEAPREEPPPCHDGAAELASSDCCSVTTTPEPENPAAPAGSVLYEIALEAAPGAELLATEHDPAESRQRQQPPRQTPQPLYTLHSAFLI